jgi:exo-beta-1,3-glucanase (GH17 family)
MKPFPFGRAINYSGYRIGQSPLEERYPSKEEILEDLNLLKEDYDYLRLFDCSLHAYRTLEVIHKENLDFKVLLGLSLFAEENHVNHPFFHHHKQDQLLKNREENYQRVDEIIALAKQYKNIVSAISIGNETRSIWNNNRVSEERLVEFTKIIQTQTKIPVTFCEEYQHWVEGLDLLGHEVDFISLHTYPAWQGASIEQALDVAKTNYQEVKSKFPNTYCIITETGWPTKSHGSRIKISEANVQNQSMYLNAIRKWAKEENILIYEFEAFDEEWKGGDHPDEPEKHWGIYTIERIKKDKL